MRKVIALLVLLLCVSTASVGLAQETATPREATAVAQKALPTLRDLVRQQKNYREMGFESLDELDRIALGEPSSTYVVRLDELEAYKEGQDPAPLLHAANRVVYPVLVGSQVRSSITVGAAAKGWEVTSFGSPNHAKVLSRVRAASAESARIPSVSLFVVEVPGLKLVFVGYRADGRIVLTPILDDAGFQFKAGQPISADKVFQRIRVAAKSHRDLPG